MTTDKKTDARNLDHATLEAMLLRAIEATKAGMMATDLALTYSTHRRTVFRWLADYYKGGKQALKATPIPGRPPKLAEPQMQSLAQPVTDQTPLQYGFEVGLWTLSILRELIRGQFGQTMALSSVSRVMSLLSITALSGLVAGPRASATVGNRGVSRHQATGTRTRRDGALCRRSGHLFRVPHGNDLGTGGTDALTAAHTSPQQIARR